MGELRVGTGTACGKIILFGEHAVVYGVPAIASGISRGVLALATPASTNHIKVDGQEVSAENDLHLAYALLRETLNCPSANLELTTQIPKGSGLGASAAMAVAAGRSLIDMMNLAPEEAPSERRLQNAAQAWEGVFHDNPSGVDVAAAQGAQPIYFRRGEEPEKLVLGTSLKIAVAQAGPPASTRMMVNGVARFKERNPVQFERTLDAIASLVENALLLLRSGDVKAVGKLMDLNQMLLAGWMLSTQEIELACRLAREAGALGAKLTGAGGGGCVIALAGGVAQGGPASDTEATCSAILGAWKSANIPCFEADITCLPSA